jgi:endonuclease/exonuclease/phosphatase family metal-dependent hydrolase
MTRPFFRALLLIFSFVLSGAAQDIRVTTLNCSWYFKPGIERPKNAHSDSIPVTMDEYELKTSNLGRMLADSGSEFFALQELGGEEPLNDIAATVGRSFGVQSETAFSLGRDTYTGQNVGAFLLPQKGRWRITEAGRVADLDRVLSKHERVRMRFENGRNLNVLVVHLIRPIGASSAKHDQQIEEIMKWIARQYSQSPNEGFVIMGDTNSNDKPPAPFSLPQWVDAFTIQNVRSTHISGRGLYDRIVVSPNLVISEVSVSELPIGRKANETVQRVWTDHMPVNAHIAFR